MWVVALPSLIRSYFGSIAPGGKQAQLRSGSSLAVRRGGRFDREYDDYDDDDDDADSEASLQEELAPALQLPPAFFARLFATLGADRNALRNFRVESEGGPVSEAGGSDSAVQAVPSNLDILLVCRAWLESAIPALYANPPLAGPYSFAAFLAVLAASGPQDSDTLFEYNQLVDSLDISGPAADNIEMGDLETSLGLCNNLQRFRLTSCFHISSKIVQSLADYAPHLSVLDLEGCPVGDGYLSDLVEGCPNLTSVNFNSTNVTFKSLDVILTGLQRLESLCLDGCQAADDGVDNVAAQIKVTPARARRASFIAAAANADVAAKRAASIRGATTIGLKRVSLAGSKPNIQDLRTLVYRAPNLEYIGLSGCETLTDAHTQTLLTGLCDPMQAKNSGPKLADLDLDGCELITDATLRALTAGGLAGQTRAHQHLTQPMGSMLDLLDGVGRIKFLSSSPLKVLGLCATGVTAGGVRALVRECGALEVVRLDYCEGMQGTFVESVAEECWAKVLEERAVRKAAKKGALLVKIGAAVPAVGVEMGRKGSVGSRLPIPVKRQSSSVSLTPPRTPVLHARAELPKDGWFRLIGHPAMDRLAAFEGVL
ncbi:hypothetical protein BC830DRAFT_1166944 [Chytriomyces sp. MP71]|nr:hypothetical protein BC830DRAFT_1166944 [Chytriomyces sp. MP71]